MAVEPRRPFATRLAHRALPELDVIRILVVDDDPQARALIEMALAEARFRPCSTSPSRRAPASIAFAWTNTTST